MATRLTGWDAIEYAKRRGCALSRHAKGADPAGRVTVEEARAIAATDPEGVYVDFDEAEGEGSSGVA